MSYPRRPHLASFALSNLASGAFAAAIALGVSGCGHGTRSGAPASAMPTVASPIATAVAAKPAAFALKLLGAYQHDGFKVSAAEIPAFDPFSKRLLVVNAQAGGVDVLDGSDMAAPKLIQFLDVGALVEKQLTLADGTCGGVNSVAVANGACAVAIEAKVKTDPGWVAFFRCSDLAPLGVVQVGAMPDMLGFSPDGTKVGVCNEAEPAKGYAVNPPGSVSIISITISSGFAAPTVAHAVFTAWDAGGSRQGEVAALVAAGLRYNTVAGATATFSQDVEPEYLAWSADGSTCYVTLQENNAIAVIAAASATVTAIRPLGFKDHGVAGNELDLSDREVDGTKASGGRIDIRTWPGVVGAYLPDGIAACDIAGRTYLVTANEGDSRESGELKDEAEVADLGTLTGPLAGLAGPQQLGRVVVLKDLSTTSKLVLFGARSFSIWDAATGAQVWDSGSELERLIAKLHPANFNADHTAPTLDNRSDNKGPEPEGVAVATIDGRTCAFIGLERSGGIAVYDITTPTAPTFVTYRNDRDFAATPAAGVGGHLGPEGLVVVPANQSPTRTTLLIVGNEVSGSTVIYEITKG